MTSNTGSGKQQKSRIIAYVDGFNLYYGLRSACQNADYNHLFQGGDPSGCLGRSLYWLDIQRVIEERLRGNEECVAVKYFSAPRGVSKLDGPAERQLSIESNERQRIYLEALQTLPLVKVILGRYMERDPWVCPSSTCGAKTPRFEEKETDVNMAVHMVRDLFEDSFDAALIVSADGDLAPPAECIRAHGKGVLLVLPPGRKRAERLKNISSIEPQNLKLKHLRGRLLPDRIDRPIGPALQRPALWQSPGAWVWRGAAPSGTRS